MRGFFQLPFFVLYLGSMATRKGPQELLLTIGRAKPLDALAGPVRSWVRLLEVCHSLSRDRLGSDTVEEFISVKLQGPKKTLAAQFGLPRFWRVFMDDATRFLGSWGETTSVPVRVKLIVLEFWPADVEDKKMILAVATTQNWNGCFNAGIPM